MQIKLETKAALDAIKMVSKFTGGIGPASGLLRLSVGADLAGVEILGAGANGQAKMVLAGAYSEAGAMVVSGDMLAKLLAGVLAETITLVASKGKVTMKAGKSSYRLAGVEDISSFPEYRAPQDSYVPIELPAERLLDALEFSLHAAADNDVRYYLCGVFFQIEDAPVRLARMVSTDGHRLSVTEVTLDNQPANDAGQKQQECIIPEASAAALIKVLGRDGTLSYRCDGNRFEIQDVGAGFSFSGNVIDGRFPDWRRVIPQGGIPSSVELDDLLATVRRANILQPDLKGHHWLRLEGGGAELRVSFDMETTGMDERIGTHGADQAAIGTLNPKYLEEALEAMGDTPAGLAFNASSESPLKVESARDDADHDYRLCVIMPCRP